MRPATASVLLAALLALPACPGPPVEGEVMTTWAFQSWRPGDNRLESATVALIDSATTSVRLVADAFSSTAVADALVEAQRRGVDVRVVGDVDLRDQLGFARVADTLQPVGGTVPVRFVNGPMIYNPDLTLVERLGEHSLLTESFVVVDELDVLTSTAGFGPTDVYHAGLRARSSYIARDFADEFDQLYAGVSAATVDGFSSPLKSVTDNREVYEGVEGRVGVYFGPQERLQKRVIDAVYNARGSVVVVAEALASNELASALRYKAEAGFDVTVVVDAEGALAPSSRVTWLQSAFAPLDNARLLIAPSVSASVVLVDADPSPIDGRRHRRIAMVLSQPFLPASPLELGVQTVSRAADSFTDANMFVIERHPTDPRYADSPEVDFVNAVVAQGAP